MDRGGVEYAVATETNVGTEIKSACPCRWKILRPSPIYHLRERIRVDRLCYKDTLGHSFGYRQNSMDGFMDGLVDGGITGWVMDE